MPRLDVPVARLSGGQRQAIAVARTVNSDADIILLDEPLAAMGAKEGAMILDLVARLRAEGDVAIIMIAHNYAHVLQSCDRVNLIQHGEITFDRPTAETSVEELNEIVVEEYRRARMAASAPREGAERWPARPSSGSTSARCRARAVVVRVADGAELGRRCTSTPTPSSSASCRRPAAAAAGLGAAGPDDYVEVLREAVPGAPSRTAASTPSDVVGIAIDFTA